MNLLNYAQIGSELIVKDTLINFELTRICQSQNSTVLKFLNFQYLSIPEFSNLWKQTKSRGRLMQLK